MYSTFSYTELPLCLNVRLLHCLCVPTLETPNCTWLGRTLLHPRANFFCAYIVFGHYKVEAFVVCHIEFGHYKVELLLYLAIYCTMFGHCKAELLFYLDTRKLSFLRTQLLGC